MTPSTRTKLIATIAAIAMSSLSGANALAQEQIGGALGSLSASGSSLTTVQVTGDPAPNSLTPSLQGITSAPSVTASQAAAAAAAPAAAPPQAATAVSGGSAN
jgi:hypothetical protein